MYIRYVNGSMSKSVVRCSVITFPAFAMQAWVGVREGASGVEAFVGLGEGLNETVGLDSLAGCVEVILGFSSWVKIPVGVQVVWLWLQATIPKPAHTMMIMGMICFNFPGRFLVQMHGWPVADRYPPILPSGSVLEERPLHR